MIIGSPFFLFTPKERGQEILTTHSFVYGHFHSSILLERTLGRIGGSTLVIPFIHPSFDKMRVNTIAGKSRNDGYKDGKLSESLFNHPQGICFDKEGNLLVADTWNNCIRKISTDNGMVTTIAGCGEGFVDGNALTEAKFNNPFSLAINDDIIYVSDTGNNAIRKISHGIVSTFATGFKFPSGITLDNNGNILVADY